MIFAPRATKSATPRADALDAALADVEALRPETTSSIGSPSTTYRDPVDYRLLGVEVAILKAREEGAGIDLVLGRVANGLTGQVNGYRERALRAALNQAYESVIDVPLEDLKAAERASSVTAPPACPECRNGKHGNCTGQALDEATDELVACVCTADGHA